MVLAVETEPQHVVVDDVDAVTERTAESGNPNRVQLDGGDQARTGGEVPGQGSVARAEFEDRARRQQTGDAGGYGPVGEEVLAELLAAADGTVMGGRGHGWPALRFDREGIRIGRRAAEQPRVAGRGVSGAASERRSPAL